MAGPQGRCSGSGDGCQSGTGRTDDHLPAALTLGEPSQEPTGILPSGAIALDTRRGAGLHGVHGTESHGVEVIQLLERSVAVNTAGPVPPEAMSSSRVNVRTTGTKPAALERLR